SAEFLVERSRDRRRHRAFLLLFYSLPLCWVRSKKKKTECFMCGIAGIVDLSGRRPVPPGILRRMADAILHRGPDEDGYFETPHMGLANRRLSIVGLADGKQPIANETGSVHVVFNGEFFDYPEKKRALEARGHHFKTHCDTELIPHLWEDHQE